MFSIYDHRERRRASDDENFGASLDNFAQAAAQIDSTLDALDVVANLRAKVSELEAEAHQLKSDLAASNSQLKPELSDTCTTIELWICNDQTDNLRAKLQQKTDECERHLDTIQSRDADLRSILRALALFDGARPISWHEVVETEVLPRIGTLVAAFTKTVKPKIAWSCDTHGVHGDKNVGDLWTSVERDAVLHAQTTAGECQIRYDSESSEQNPIWKWECANHGIATTGFGSGQDAEADSLKHLRNTYGTCGIRISTVDESTPSDLRARRPSPHPVPRAEHHRHREERVGGVIDLDAIRRQNEDDKAVQAAVVFPSSQIVKMAETIDSLLVAITIILQDVSLIAVMDGPESHSHQICHDVATTIARRFTL